MVAAAGNMRTGGPAKTAAALARTVERMTAQERDLYGQAFDTFAAKLNSMQSDGLASEAAAHVIELAEQTPRRALRRWGRMPKRCSGSFARNPTPSKMRSASSSLA